MKNFLLLLLLTSWVGVLAQPGYPDTISCISLARITEEKNFCDTASPVGFQLILDTTLGNLWQEGHTLKFGGLNTRDTACALITDSLNPYPVSNYSAFAIHLPQDIGLNWMNYNYYFRFWHRFETDSLRDGCWLEFSTDTGHTWFRIDTISMGWPFNSFSNGWNACNLYNNDLASTSMDTLLDGRKAWSGSSAGWRYTALWLNLAMPIKPGRNGTINAVRFVFQSDSLPENKSGWMIQELRFGYVNVSGIQNPQGMQVLPVYPNPSGDGRFYFELPQHLESSLEVYSAWGSRMNVPQEKQMLDLSAEPDGIYFYRVCVAGKLFKGILMKK